MAAQATMASPCRAITSPGLLLRLEGAAFAIAGVWAFHTVGLSWWWFGALLLLPDVGLLGYLAGPQLGARTYNGTHTLVGPLTLAVAGAVADATMPAAIAAVWVAHIGIDRLAGFGLKCPTGARPTHLQQVR